jgi:anti-sigma factor RsiW
MTSCSLDITELDLLAYADGRLDGMPDRKAEVEAYLRERPALDSILRADQRVVAKIRDAFAPIAHESPPRRLSAALSPARSPKQGLYVRPAWLAAAAPVLVLALVLGWRLGEAVRPPQSLAARDMGELFPIVQNGAETALAGDVAAFSGDDSAPDLSNWSLSQTSAFTAIADGREVLRATYSDESGGAVTIMRSVAQTPHIVSIATSDVDGQHAIFWTEEGVSYSVSGNLPETELSSIAAYVRNRGLPAPSREEPAARPEPEGEQAVVAEAEPAQSAGDTPIEPTVAISPYRR